MRHLREVGKPVSKVHQDQLLKMAKRFHRSRWVNDNEHRLLLDAAAAEWDDAVHFEAPWDLRVSLCGKWDRNLIPIDTLGDHGGNRCWSCLQVALWLRNNTLPPQTQEPLQ